MARIKLKARMSTDPIGDRKRAARATKLREGRREIINQYHHDLLKAESKRDTALEDLEEESNDDVDSPTDPDDVKSGSSV